VQDPGNLGAIVRVSEGAGASGVMAVGACADPFGWKAIRGSMGSTLRLPIATHATAGAALEQAQAHDCRVLALCPRGGRSIFEVDLTGPTAVLVGGEGAGLPSSVVAAADEVATIPTAPAVESLNVAVAAALVVYEARRQRDRANGAKAEGYAATTRVEPSAERAPVAGSTSVPRRHTPDSRL
jgi:RNA methyltransferase, TrmH family